MLIIIKIVNKYLTICFIRQRFILDQLITLCSTYLLVDSIWFLTFCWYYIKNMLTMCQQSINNLSTICQ